MTFDETVEFLIKNPCSVIFCKESSIHSIYPHGRSFTPYMHTSATYYGKHTQDNGFFIVEETGYRTIQKEFCVPMHKWATRIRAAAKSLPAIPSFVQERIERTKLSLDGGNE